MKRPVRIGNAQAFWGDRGDAAAELLAREPQLDYLTMDYLAEVSMSILAAQRQHDPQAGYARDFVDVVRSLAGYWSAGGRCRLIVNAGGLNPLGCAEACRAALQEVGCSSLQIGIVSGDDVFSELQAASQANQLESFSNLDTQQSVSHIRDRLVTANAYLGATPIVAALAAGADIVITGRVADPSLVVAACRHHFGWPENDYQRIAGATVAGHLIECGTQVTGGISTDWLEIADPAHLGFPLVEVSEDGSCLVTKPAGTGGRVTAMTVKEQLVYEIGDPVHYLSPDASVSFHALQVDDLGNDRVHVWGAVGSEYPSTYKVSATYRDGFRAAGTLTIVGRHAVEKATHCGELVLQRVREAGGKLRETLIECLGSGACAAGVVPAPELFETVLRIAVEAESREACERFSRELMPFVTAGPQGTTGYAEGRPRIHSVIRYWPCRIERTQVTPLLHRLDHVGKERCRSPEPSTPAGDRNLKKGSRASVSTGSASQDAAKAATYKRLFDIACARSGDKGVNANIGIISRHADYWPWLCEWLTAERVANFLRPLGFRRVERYELANLQALNFVLYGVLSGLRTDAQGKTLGQILLELPLPDKAVGTMK